MDRTRVATQKNDWVFVVCCATVTLFAQAQMAAASADEAPAHDSALQSYTSLTVCKNLNDALWSRHLRAQ